MTEAFRLEMYLVRLDWHLEGLLAGADRKAAIAALRHELETDPRGIVSALADLGAPRALARRYADEEPLRPRWSKGLIVAGIALLGYWIVFGAFTTGLLSAVRDAAPSTAHATFLWIPVEAFDGADGFGIGWSGEPQWVIVPAVIVAIAYLLGARVWRAFRR